MLCRERSRIDFVLALVSRMLFAYLGVTAYILEVIPIRRGSGSLCRLRTVDPIRRSDFVQLLPNLRTRTMSDGSRK